MTPSLHVDVARASNPAGSVATHGSEVADGTDCAIRTIRSLGPALGGGAHLDVVGRPQHRRGLADHERHADDHEAERERDPADAPPLQRDRTPVRAEGSELLDQAAPVGLHRGSQLRRAGDAAAAANASAISSRVKNCSARR